MGKDREGQRPYGICMFDCVITKRFVELTCRVPGKGGVRYFVSDKCGLKCLEMAWCPESLSPAQGPPPPLKSHLVIYAGMVTNFPLRSLCSLSSSPHGGVSRGSFLHRPRHATTVTPSSLCVVSNSTGEGTVCGGACSASLKSCCQNRRN